MSLRKNDFAAIAKRIRRHHEMVNDAGRNQCEYARSAGEELAQVWDQLKTEHRLVKWLEEEAKIEPRTAQNYLKIYRNWAICETISHMGVAGVLEHLRKLNQDDAPRPFDIGREADGIAAWLVHRMEAWPEEMRAGFVELVRLQLDLMEAETDARRRCGIDKADADSNGDLAWRVGVA